MKKLYVVLAFGAFHCLWLVFIAGVSADLAGNLTCGLGRSRWVMLIYPTVASWFFLLFVIAEVDSSVSLINGLVPSGWLTSALARLLALSYHGRKGLPVAARLALLDTRCLEYQHACIGSLETTLNCGTVVVTFYPNFNMALDDPQLHNFLKVQLQITGVDQVQDTYQATLHYQMAYRVQNHAFDLVLPVTNDALLITVDTNQRATCTHVPRQIPKEDLQKLLPSSWITNYEKLHQSSVPIQSTEPEFTKKANGTVEIIFKKGESSTSPPGIFSSSISMVQPAPAPLPVPIESFSKDGCPIYAFSQDNHVFWDICSCESCSNEDLEADFPKHKRKSSGQKLKVRYNHGDRTIDTLGQPSDKFDYLVKYTPPSWEPPEQVPTFSMYQPTNSYDDDFPALQEQVKDRVRTLPQVHNPQGVNADGRSKQVTQAEAVLNWQSQNAIAQNSVLHRIESKVDLVQTNLKKMTVSVDSRILHLEQLCAEIQQRISTIHEYLILQASTGRHVDPQKEHEIQSLKIQLKSLQAELAKSRSKPLPFPEPPQNKMTSYYPDPYWAKHSSSYNPQPPPATPQLFGNPDTEKLFKPLPKRDKGKISIPTTSKKPRSPAPIISSSSDSFDSKKHEPDDPFQDSQDPYQLMIQSNQPSNPIQSILTKYSQQTIPKILTHEPLAHTSEEETPDDEALVTSEESFTEDDSFTCSMPPLLMAAPFIAHSSDHQSSQTRQEPPPTSTTRVSMDEPISSDDEINLNPRHFQTHIHSPSTGGYFTLDDIPRVKWQDRILEFHSWLTSYMLKDNVTLRDALQQFSAKFSGTLWDWFHALGDYRQMQFVNSASLSEALGWLHYEFLGEALNDKEIARYHILSGPDDPSLKHAFLASIPRDLAEETFRLFKTRKEVIDNQSLGTIFHQVLEALNKMCDQHKYFTKLLQPDKTMLRACKRPDLLIKCSDDADCNCPLKKKKHFKKIHRSSFNGRQKKMERKGHFAKACPQKKAQSLKLIDFLAQNTKFNPDNDEVESLFSLTDEITPDTIAAVADESSDDEIYELYQAQPTIPPSHPLPLAHVTILTSTYAKPIKAIALFDTGAHRTILNPKVLPPYCWVTHKEYFRAADNQVFCTQYKTKKPITIQILPQCSVKTHVLGSPLPGKDLVIGFDVYFKSKFKILPRGIQYKAHFLPYTLTPSLYEMQPSSTDYIALIKAQIIHNSCSNSHQEFLAKCSHPLWKNPQFFIKLPFKLNEDINPTKASHSGMNPEHKMLAQEEYGVYTPDTHIAEELQKFSYGPLTRKQAQQFLGIVQYLRNFIPRVAQMTRPLQLMLKKDADPWTEKQTQAVKKLKTATQNLLALVIPSTGNRILQTDASD
uniref:Uncharacterized protein n=1 Tax=Populus alba TaxID=43335 RepID=A0A4U5P3S2_POPAL|nr:hypothetical protein D5086_0000228410 [Populus alba]